MENFFERIEKNIATVDDPQFITQKRHWGFSVTLDANTRIHTAKGEPSLHFHRHRVEEYIVYSGEMIVYRGQIFKDDLEKTVANLVPITLKPGDKALIPINTVHIPINLREGSVVFIEISHGPYEEGDVERVYDKSGRDESLAKRWNELGYDSGLGVSDLIQAIKDKRKN